MCVSPRVPDWVFADAAAVLCGRYSNGKVWAISAKNSATGTEMFGGDVDEVSTVCPLPSTPFLPVLSHSSPCLRTFLAHVLLRVTSRSGPRTAGALKRRAVDCWR